MNNLWLKIKAWFDSKGGAAHVGAAVIAGAVTCYAAVPAFHQLVINIWAKTPPALREIGAAIGGIYTWYRAMHQINATPPPKQ